MKVHEKLARIREHTERMRKAREQTAIPKTTLFMAEHHTTAPAKRRPPTVSSMNAITAHFLK